MNDFIDCDAWYHREFDSYGLPGIRLMSSSDKLDHVNVQIRFDGQVLTARLSPEQVMALHAQLPRRRSS